jgi:hypothetical protein
MGTEGRLKKFPASDEDIEADFTPLGMGGEENFKL